MTKRAVAVADTRRKIVNATVAAHRENGIRATSWDEIAERAEVGVGTVYRHFPSLEELIPACGAVISETLALPGAEDAPELFTDASGTRERIERLVAELFGAYERGAPFIWNIRREREDVPDLEPYHRFVEGSHEALVREALSPLEPADRDVDVVRALTDVATWTAFRERLSAEKAAETAVELIERWACTTPDSRMPTHGRLTSCGN